MTFLNLSEIDLNLTFMLFEPKELLMFQVHHILRFRCQWFKIRLRFKCVNQHFMHTSYKNDNFNSLPTFIDKFSVLLFCFMMTGVASFYISQMFSKRAFSRKLDSRRNVFEVIRKIE